MPSDAGPDTGVHRPLQGAAGHDRAAARAVLPLGERPVRPRASLGHRRRGVHRADPPAAAPDGDLDVRPAEDDAVGGDGAGPAENDAVHAHHLHLHVLELPDRARRLLAGQQHPRHRAADDVQPQGGGGKGRYRTGNASPRMTRRRGDDRRTRHAGRDGRHLRRTPLRPGCVSGRRPSHRPLPSPRSREDVATVPRPRRFRRDPRHRARRLLSRTAQLHRGGCRGDPSSRQSRGSGDRRPGGVRRGGRAGGAGGVLPAGVSPGEDGPDPGGRPVRPHRGPDGSRGALCAAADAGRPPGRDRPAAGAASLPPHAPGGGDRLRGRGRCPGDNRGTTIRTGIGNNGAAEGAPAVVRGGAPVSGRRDGRDRRCGERREIAAAQPPGGGGARDRDGDPGDHAGLSPRRRCHRRRTGDPDRHGGASGDGGPGGAGRGAAQPGDRRVRGSRPLRSGREPGGVGGGPYGVRRGRAADASGPPEQGGPCGGGGGERILRRGEEGSLAPLRENGGGDRGSPGGGRPGGGAGGGRDPGAGPSDPRAAEVGGRAGAVGPVPRDGGGGGGTPARVPCGRRPGGGRSPRGTAGGGRPGRGPRRDLRRLLCR